MDVRCDAKDDCEDGSDEADCRAFTTSVGYNSFHVPPPQNGSEERLKINMTVDILEIIEVNEVMGFFKAKLVIGRSWIDKKLTYQNLKKSHDNEISEKDTNSLWIPFTSLRNIESKHKYSETDTPAKLLIKPNANFEYEIGDNTYIDNTYLFHGSENILYYEKEYTVEWICDFHLEWYPFDTQSCTMQFKQLQENDLVPALLTFSGPRNLPQHHVQDFRICTAEIEGAQGVIVEIILSRPTFSNFVTVTLPTGLLLLLSQMVTAFSQDFLDMVVTVNLTVLLVQATL